MERRVAALIGPAPIAIMGPPDKPGDDEYF